MFHSVFTPSSMSLDELSQTLVQRGRLVERLISILGTSKPGASTHNILLIGPRGIGKTHLVSLVYKRLRANESFSRNNCIAYLKEDEWGVTSYEDFLVRVAESLLEEVGGGNITPLLNAKYGKGTRPSEANILSIIFDQIGSRNLLIIVENLDQVFGLIHEDGQQKLRSLLQNYPRFNFLGTTPSLFSGIARQSSPFYGFFQLTHLKPLSVDDAVSLMHKLSIVSGDRRTADFIATPVGRARIKAVQHLAGGNHRIFVLFYDFLSQSGSDNVIGPLMRTIDALTPYYQSQMAKLSPQQQKIVAFLCQQRVPVNVKTLAESCFMTQQTAASQLKQILRSRYVRVTRSGRESYYELAEPLLRICVEVKTHREGPLKLLVEFLRFWFSREELEEHLSTVAEACLERTYFSAALQEYEASDGHEHLSPEIESLCRSIDDKHKSWQEIDNDSLELAELSKRAEDWGHYVRGMTRLKRAPEAAEYLSHKLLMGKPTHRILDALGTALQSSNDYVKALEYFRQASILSPDSGYTYLDIADCLLSTDQFDEAAAMADLAVKKNKKLSTRANILRARVLLEKEKPLDALALLSRFRAQEPDNVEVMNWTAAALSANHKPAEAIDLLKKAEKLEPGAVYLKLNLARELSGTGKHKAALEKLDKVDELTGNTDKRVQQIRSSVLFASEQYGEAEKITPAEILSHSIYHRLLDVYNADITPDQLKNILLKLSSAVKTKRWEECFVGSLTEFLRHAKDWGEEDAIKLRRWLDVSRELFAARPEYELYLRMFEVLISVKFENHYKALLSLSLEERRLLVTEAEEQKLLGSKELGM
jgi:tetratricopeptide (TPR) repeat protein